MVRRVPEVKEDATYIVNAERKDKAVRDLSHEDKWKLLLSFLEGSTYANMDLQFSLKEGISCKFINSIFTKIRNLKETQYLMKYKKDPGKLSLVRRRDLDPAYVNEAFLAKLSMEDEVILSDSELLFAEYYLDSGDEIGSIRLAKLDEGLDPTDTRSYKEACKIRAFFLRRKGNVANYMNEMKKRDLEVLGEGKLYIQQQLIEVIEQLKSLGSARDALPQRLKALEYLAKTVGAFEEKITIETVSGDDALDMIIAKAKEVRANE